MLRIAAFARLAGVSAKLLRAWDAIGLFRPAWIDAANGYRYYSPAQLPELRRIAALRDLGVPLAQLVELVGGGGDLRTMLERRRRDLERERHEVERRLRALEITVATAGRGTGLDVVVQRLPRELVATMRLDPASPDENAAFYALETVVRDLLVRAHRPPGTLLPTRAAGPDVPAAVYVPITRRIADVGGITVGELPACRVAAAIHRGPYEGLAETRAALERWVSAASLVPAGRVRVVYLQFGAETELRVPPAWVVGHDADFVTELQLELA